MTRLLHTEILLMYEKHPLIIGMMLLLEIALVIIEITLVNSDSFIGVELYIDDDKALFDSLFSAREVIENESGLDYEWQRLENKKASRILHKIPGLDFDNRKNYPQMMDEVIKKVGIMKEVFKKHIK